MADCAPRALTASLPTVVPRLTDLVSDSNPQVVQRAGQSLTQIAQVITNPLISDYYHIWTYKPRFYSLSQVITNPEIVLVTPKLLAALTEPNTETKVAINSPQIALK